MNTCATHGVEIADKIVAHQMLKSVNISQGKKEIILTTLKDFTADNMRNQILRLFCDDQVPVVEKFRHVEVKSEPCDEQGEFAMLGYRESSYGRSSNGNNYQSSSSSTGNCQKKRYRGNNKSRNKQQGSSNNQLKRNPLDEFGNPTYCDFCHSILHYVGACPDQKKNNINHSL